MGQMLQISQFQQDCNFNGIAISIDQERSAVMPSGRRAKVANWGKSTAEPERLFPRARQVD
jgi:hypothetical protein